MIQQRIIIPWLATLCAVFTPAVVSAASVAELLEQGLYKEETTGDLQGAIKIYSAIAANTRANRPHIVQALYRLGVCYIKLGKHKQALATFNNLLQEFPDQQSWVEKTQQRLHEQGQLDLPLKPAPWKDGEVTRYLLKSPSGADAGVSGYTIKQSVAENKVLWVVENHTAVLLEDMHQYSVVEMMQDNLQPMNTRLKNSLIGDFQIDYDSQQLRLSADNKGKKSSRDIPVQSPLYDSEQMLSLLRRLPLTPTYQIPFSVFSAITGVVNDVKLSVTGTEKITVPAGSFDCYTVDIVFYTSGRPTQTFQAWVAIDNSQQVVKYQSNYVTMELSEVDDVGANAPVIYQHSSLNLSIQAPNGWAVFDITKATGAQHDVFLQLLPPEHTTIGMFIAKDLGADVLSRVSVGQIIDGDLVTIKGYFKDYILRANSRIDLTISGLAAQSFVADYEFQDKAMVEYRAYIQGKSTIYWFVFRTKKEVFEANYNQISKLVAGFNAK